MRSTSRVLLASVVSAVASMSFASAFASPSSSPARQPAEDSPAFNCLYHGNRLCGPLTVHVVSDDFGATARFAVYDASGRQVVSPQPLGALVDDLHT